jgi:hypothetical protein
MPGPSLDLLVFQIGETKKLAVVANTPDEFVGVLRVGPLLDGMRGEQVVREKGKISGLVRAGVKVVRERPERSNPSPE